MVFVIGGSSLSLTYIASERIIPGYVCNMFAWHPIFKEKICLAGPLCFFYNSSQVDYSSLIKSNVCLVVCIIKISLIHCDGILNSGMEVA